MSLSLSKIDDLIEALLQNASDLVAESKLLHQHCHFARANALAHIAREELSRSVMLQAAGFRMLAGSPVDWKRLMRRLRNHEDKIKLEGVQSATHLRALGQTEQATLVLRFAGKMAKHRNQRKNAALYVELDEGVLSMPAKAFTEEQAVRTLTLADMWLQEQVAVRSKIGRYDQCNPTRYRGMYVPTPEDIAQLDPLVLLKALGEAQEAIWKHQAQANDPC